VYDFGDRIVSMSDGRIESVETRSEGSGQWAEKTEEK
jgi:hypothetical protein